MKQVFKFAPLAVAVAAVTFSTWTVAGSGGPPKGDRGGEGAHLSKHVHVSKHVSYKGQVEVDGVIQVDSLGMAVIDQEQDSDNNLNINDRVDNDAIMSNNALRGSKGNIGVNISGGDNNVQSNAAALAAADASFVFGSADAEIFVDQNSEDNVTFNWGTVNDAKLTGNALRGAKGNIGVNIAAGNSNAQANSFAGAVASGSMGEATVSVAQETEGNMVHNLPEDYIEVVTTNFSVGGTMSGSYSGNGSGSYSGTNGPANYAGTNGPATYSGTSDQAGDVYLDAWTGDQHPAGSPDGHIDVDSVAQGAQDPNGDGGAFLFNDSGTISASRERGRIGPSSASGNLGFTEAGTQSLSGTLSGSVDHLIVRYNRHENNAHFNGDALNGARGNIGVNITAGSGNLQNNSMALSRVNSLGTGGGEPSPGGE